MRLAGSGLATATSTKASVMSLTRRSLLGSAIGGAAAYSMGVRPTFAQGAPIKVGILHSLSGTMAISETTSRT